MGGICSSPQEPFKVSGIVVGQGEEDCTEVQHFDTVSKVFVEGSSSQIKYGECFGSLGYVDLFYGKMGPTPVTVFKFNAKASTCNSFEEALVDTKLLATIQHPSIARVIAAKLESPGACYLTKHYQFGSLDIILYSSKVKIPPKSKISILLQVSEAIQYLHSFEPEIIHRNLKPSAIWVESKWVVGVTDFGFEKIRGEFRTQSLSSEANAYRDPLVFKGEKTSKESDIYAIGMLMWAIWSCKIPFEGLNSIKVGQDLIRGVRPETPSDCPPAFVELMKSCWDGEKQNRPTLQKVVETFRSLM